MLSETEWYDSKKYKGLSFYDPTRTMMFSPDTWIHCGWTRGFQIAPHKPLVVAILGVRVE